MSAERLDLYTLRTPVTLFVVDYADLVVKKVKASALVIRHMVRPDFENEDLFAEEDDPVWVYLEAVIPEGDGLVVEAAAEAAVCLRPADVLSVQFSVGKELCWILRWQKSGCLAPASSVPSGTGDQNAQA